MIRATRTLGALEAEYREQGWWDGRLLTDWNVDPGHTAIVDGSVSMTYAGLTRTRDRMAAALTGLGLEPGQVVTLELPNWWETSALMHASMAARAVINPVVPIYREAELTFILRQSRTSVLCVPHRFRGFDYVAMAERIMKDLDRPPRVVVVRGEGVLPAGFTHLEELLDERPVPGDSARADGEQPGDEPGEARAASSDIVLLLYTSGTTADPKGVLHSHDTLRYENLSMANLLGLSAGDTVFMPSPLTHITGLLYGVLLPPMLGSTAVYLDVWEPGPAADLIEEHGCRLSIGATPFLQDLVETYHHRATGCSLRLFACGGADVPPELVYQARRTLGAAVMRVYGSSEFPTYSCSPPDAPAEVAAETDGLPIGPVEHRIVGSAGAPGELVVRGPDLFLGYLDPALNEDAFTPDGWFRTGDLATEVDGAITIRGREKDIIIRGGENLSARQIEDLLYQHPSVREVAVVAMPDPRMGEKACAFVVPVPGATPTLVQLCSFLEESRVARQKFPERVELVAELPKTPSGKIRKFVLRDQIRAQLESEQSA
jgi:acyl-CoA synthetase (AMP-forming)/AMP-acid ligase II